MLMKIECEAEFTCPPEDLFPWMADPQKAMRWQTGVKTGEILQETPDRIGTKFREIVEDESGRLEMLGEITDFIPGEIIAFHLESRIHSVDVRYTVVPQGRRSHLTIDSSVRWKFPMSIISLFIGRKIKAGINRQLETEIGELRKLCEVERGA